MQDNRLQLIAEVKAKMEDALDFYYKTVGSSREAVEAAHSEYQKLKNEYHELTGEPHGWD